jgi:type III pantothenate kinase
MSESWAKANGCEASYNWDAGETSYCASNANGTAETSKLPLSTIWIDNKLIGDDTLSSINSGVINGVISEIEGIIAQYEQKFLNIKIILTGGDSNFLLKNIKNTIFADQNFLLKGLNYLLEVNTK